MTNIIKISTVASVLMFALFAFGTFSVTAFAFGESGDGGCCGGGGGGYSQSDYYSQGNYYSQSDYYSQSTYYTQGDYYSQSTYYTQGTYNTYAQADYYSQSTYSQPVASCDLFTGSPTTLPFGGGTVKLKWETTNATAVSIDNGVGTVSADGEKNVTVTTDTTFKLTADGTGGDDDCTVTIDVQNNTYSQGSYYGQGSYNNYSQGSYNNYSQGSYGGGGSSSPKCELKASAKKINKGKEVELSWETTRATDVVIKDNHGKTLIDTDDLSNSDKKDFYDGEIKVRPTKDTTYTLTASKGSKDKECKVKIEVDNEVTVLEVRDQKPLVSGISLTTVPYTGFEAGPVLTFIFYTLLTLWALFLAYFFVIKKKVS